MGLGNWYLLYIDAVTGATEDQACTHCFGETTSLDLGLGCVVWKTR